MVEDLTGKVFGWLTVIKKLNTKRYSYIDYLCKCKCGKTIVLTSHDLRAGRYKSCGCYNRYKAKLPRSHGDSYTRLYAVYRGMYNRCYCKSNKKYKNYGARGIIICDEWLHPDGNPAKGYINFYNWAYANGYYDQPKGTSQKDILTIDRIDNDGPYAPWNCRWIPFYMQHKHTSKTVIVTDGNEEVCFVDAMRKYGAPQFRSQLITRGGWTIDEVITKVITENRHGKRLLRSNKTKMGISRPLVDEDGFVHLTHRAKTYDLI